MNSPVALSRRTEFLTNRLEVAPPVAALRPTPPGPENPDTMTLSTYSASPELNAMPVLPPCVHYAGSERFIVKALADMASGSVLKVVATDPGSVCDMAAFAEQTGNALLEQSTENSKYVFLIKKA